MYDALLLHNLSLFLLILCCTLSHSVVSVVSVSELYTFKLFFDTETTENTELFFIL